MTCTSRKIERSERWKGEEKKCFVFFRIHFGVYSSNRKSERQHCRLSASARSQLMVFFLLWIRLSLQFFDIGSFHRNCCFSYIFFFADFFPACDFQFNRRASLWWRWLRCGQVSTEANIPANWTVNTCIKESRSKGFFCWTPRFGASQCNSRQDSIEWSLTQNLKKMYGADICVSTPHRERRLVWSYSRCQCAHTNWIYINKIGGERNANEIRTNKRDCDPTKLKREKSQTCRQACFCLEKQVFTVCGAKRK